MKNRKTFISRVLLLLIVIVMSASLGAPVYAANVSEKTICITVGEKTEADIRTDLKNLGISDGHVNSIVVLMKRYQPGTCLKMGTVTNQGTTAICCYPVDKSEIAKDPNETVKKQIAGFKTSPDAEKLGKDHIGYDYVSLDWSTASESYITARLNKQMGVYTECKIIAYDENYSEHVSKFILEPDEDYILPLQFGSTEYFVTIQPYYKSDVMEKLSDAEWAKIERPALTVRFKAGLKDPDAWLVLSNSKIDFAHAEKTAALAKDLTKNCKTDAQKVETICNWVAKNIKYDHKLASDIQAYGNKLENGANLADIGLFKDGARENLDIDGILSRKSGVCEDQADLAAAMLRSLGIPCKVASGKVYDKNSVNKNCDGWHSHAWVLVSPDVKNLNIKGLHGGYGDNKFYRIDITNMLKTSARGMTETDKNYLAISEY